MRKEGKEGGSRMSVSVLRKEEGEEKEGCRKILAVFLPSLLFCFPPADRDYYGQGGRRGRWTAAKMPIPFAAADCPGRERGVGHRRRDPVDSRRHGCRSGLIAHFNIQRSRGGRRSHGDGGENVVAATCIFNDVIFHASWT